MSVSIKTVLDENIHRFTLPRVSFEELERALFTIYGKSVLAIRYQDEDGDLISVSSTPELQEALRVANGKTLKLLLSRIDSGKKEEASETENSLREEQAKAQAEKESQMLAEKARAEKEAQMLAEMEERAAAAKAQAEAEAAAKAQAEREAQKIADAKLLAEYQAELESAQQELKLAAEAAKQAKQAAAQAFWEAEEMKERAMKEAREKEEALLLEKEQRRQQEEVASKLQQQREREQQELDALIERQRVMQEELEREELLALNTTPIATPSEPKRSQNASQAFWDAEEAREQAEKEARKLEEARWREKESVAKPEDEKAVHTTIQCDVCNVFPIVGTRYQCTLCPDFDLCEKCEATPHAHPLTHPLVKHKLPASTATVHRGVTCDNCGQSPIVGARFKCKVCPNFDLCEDCESKDVHPGDHALFKFRKERVRPGFRMGGRQCGRPLMRGACGPRVSRLQERLGMQVDGFFGPVTEEAVKQFQANNGLMVDGIVGPQTREKLGLSNLSAPGGLFDLLFSFSNQ